MIKSLIRTLISAYIALIGLYIIIHSATSRLHHPIDFFYPYDSARLSKMLGLVISLVLINVSWHLLKRRRRAFYIVVSGLIVLILINLLHMRDLDQIFIYSVALVLLFINRADYSVKSDNISFRYGLFSALIVLAAALLYGTIGFYYLERRDIGYDLSLWQSFRAALIQFFTFGNGVYVAYTRHGRWFLDSIDLAGFVAVIISISALFKPLQFIFESPRSDIVRAENILKKYSDSTEDFFKLWPRDKHYYFYNIDEAFISYKVMNGVALILDGLSGKEECFEALLTEFKEFARENGWTTAIIHCSEGMKSLAETLDYNYLAIGQEAIIDIEIFIRDTATDKHFRYIKNKSVRDGLSFELWKAPLNDRQISKLYAISQAWKSEGGRREYTFAMAPFNDSYISKSDVAVVLQNGHPIAYSNLIPSYLRDARTIDHMRSIPNTSSMAMHFLFINLLSKLHDDSIKYFNLGFSPLVGVKKSENNTFIEKTLLITKKLSNFYFAASGLEEFKSRYHPIWEKKYICYENGLPNLLKSGLALNKAMQIKHPVKLSKLLVIYAFFAGLFYSSFPLAYYLNPGKFAVGYVSALGSIGQPYAWVFNLLDILSGIILVFVSYELWKILKDSNLYLRVSIFSFGLSGIGTLLAAIFTLPSQIDSTSEVGNILHILTSMLSSGGLLISMMMLAYYLIKYKKPATFIYLFGILFGLAGILTLGLFLPNYQNIFQRLFIALGGVWMVMFTFFMSKRHSTIY